MSGAGSTGGVEDEEKVKGSEGIVGDGGGMLKEGSLKKFTKLFSTRGGSSMDGSQSFLQKSADGEKLVDTINNELLQLHAAARETMKSAEEAVQRGWKMTESAIRDTQARLKQSVKDSDLAFRDAQQKMSDVTQSKLEETVKDAQERLLVAQAKLKDWQETRIKKLFEPVPFQVPMTRRRQTFAVMVWNFVFLFPGTLIFLFLSCVLLLNKYTAAFILPYFLWILTFDCNAYITSRKWTPLRKLRLWHHMANFFPAALVKTANLDPEKRYIFGVHPHGVISIGAFLNFASEGTDFSCYFPGINVRLCTLDNNFFIPIGREILLFLGLVGASRYTFRYLCDNSRPDTAGNAVAVVVGGAAEALEAAPGKYSFVIDGRKGFVRMALEMGAQLVPVISFGENNLYTTLDNPSGSPYRKFQELMKKMSGISPIVFYGRGAFNYAFGFLPFRRPIVTVVGNPIEVPQYQGADVYRDEAGKRLTDEYHAKYVKALSKLFEENVHLYDSQYKSFSVK